MVAQLLCVEGVDVDAPLRLNEPRIEGMLAGLTILQTACWFRDQPDIIKQLLRHGADPARRCSYSGRCGSHQCASRHLFCGLLCGDAGTSSPWP